MFFSKSKEVQDAIEHYQKASNPSSKFHQYFVSAQNFAAPNPNSNVEINIANKNVSYNNSNTNKQSDQLPLGSKPLNIPMTNHPISNLNSNLEETQKSEIHQKKNPANAMVVHKTNDTNNTIQSPRNGLGLVPYIKDVSNFQDVQTNLIPGEDIATATKRIYKIHQVYESCSGLVSNIYAFALERGFRSTRFGSSIKCNRAHYKRPGWSSKDAKNSMRCGCEFKIKFRWLHYKKTKMTDPVIITAIHPYHTNGCEPNKDQLALTSARSGDYSKFNLQMMKDLMAMTNLKKHVDSDAIKALLLKTFPKKKIITEHDINNARIKRKILQKQIVQSGATMETFRFDHTTIKGLLKGIDDSDDNLSSNEKNSQQFIENDSTDKTNTKSQSSSQLSNSNFEKTNDAESIIEHDVHDSCNENSNSNDFIHFNVNSSNHINCLSYESFMNTASNLFSAVEKNPKHKTIVSGFLLQLLDTVKCRKEKQIDIDSFEQDCNLLIKRYKSTFIKSKNSNISEQKRNDPLMRTPPSNINDDNRKRLTSVIELKQMALKKQKRANNA